MKTMKFVGKEKLQYALVEGVLRVFYFADGKVDLTMSSGAKSIIAHIADGVKEDIDKGNLLQKITSKIRDRPHSGSEEHLQKWGTELLQAAIPDITTEVIISMLNRAFGNAVDL